jgi:hypothetical protein
MAGQIYHDSRWILGTSDEFNGSWLVRASLVERVYLDVYIFIYTFIYTLLNFTPPSFSVERVSGRVNCNAVLSIEYVSVYIYQTGKISTRKL